MSKFWKKAIFWEMVRNSLAIFGMPSGALAAYFEAEPKLLLISAISGAGVGLMSIWFADHNKNGIVDIFEDEKEH